MSLTGAMTSAVTGLQAQSQTLAVVSDNISNSSTVGYKAGTPSFSTLLTEQSSPQKYSSGGVRSRPLQNISQQGLLEPTGTVTDLAIDGQGFFVVADSAASGKNSFSFTRSGEFRPDAEGYLVNSAGYYLQGWSVDRAGVPTTPTTDSLSSLEPIKVSRISGTATPTSELTLRGNLPADAAVGDSFDRSTEIFDSLGVGHSLGMTWTKTAPNEWSLSLTDPSAVGAPGVPSGTVGGGPFTVQFNGDGSFSSVVPSPPTVSVTGWSTGASDSTIDLDFGQAGAVDALAQRVSDRSPPTVDLAPSEQDGTRFGNFVNVTIESDGLVTANYDNGESWPIYKVPLATFPNPDGMAALGGNVYQPTIYSGDYSLSEANSGSTGRIASSSLEASTVDLADEFSRMIVAQQAYSAASSVVTTADEMFNTLVQMVR